MFEYEIKGVTLTMADMGQICEHYQAASTAEYLIENYDLTDEEAMNLGYEVRRRMHKYGHSEEDAIDEVMARRTLLDI